MISSFTFQVSREKEGGRRGGRGRGKGKIISSFKGEGGEEGAEGSFQVSSSNFQGGVKQVIQTTCQESDLNHFSKCDPTEWYMLQVSSLNALSFTPLLRPTPLTTTSPPTPPHTPHPPHLHTLTHPHTSTRTPLCSSPLPHTPNNRTPLAGVLCEGTFACRRCLCNWMAGVGV